MLNCIQEQTATPKRKGKREMQRMSNAQIIETTAAMMGLDTSAEYRTYQQWKLRGYQVQKGQKAAMTVGLWTPTKASKKQQEENPEAKTRLWLKTSALFTIDQVKQIETKGATA